MEKNIRISSADITKLLEIEIKQHAALRGTTDKGIDWESGFIAGLEHAKENLVIAAEVLTLTGT